MCQSELQTGLARRGNVTARSEPPAVPVHDGDQGRFQGFKWAISAALIHPTALPGTGDASATAVGRDAPLFPASARAHQLTGRAAILDRCPEGTSRLAAGE